MMELVLKVHSGRMAVCQLPAHLEIEQPAADNVLWALVVTAEERSLVCPEEHVPQQAIKVEKGWRVMQVQGPLDFGLIGVLANLSQILAQAAVSIFVLSTYDTDYLLVKEAQLNQAILALQQAGHSISWQET